MKGKEGYRNALILVLLAVFGFIIMSSGVSHAGLEDGLVGSYPFNGNANDESGNGNDGTVNGATLTEDRFGNANSAYSFNGTSDHISIPVDINPGLRRQLTMTAWAKADSDSPIRQVISHDNGGFDRSLGIDFRGGGTGWSAFSGSGAVLGYHPVEVGEWVFLAIVYDQDTETVTLYVNDSKYEEMGSLGSGWDYTLIGSNPSFGEYFAGVIDDIRIYDRMLSESEIHELYIPSPNEGLVAYYPFNGNANDESGNGNDGTVNGATLTEDRFGNANSAYTFDGVDDYIQIMNSETLEIGFDDYTIAAWIKTNATNNGRIFSKGSSGCVTGYMMRMNGSDILLENAFQGDCKIAFAGNVTVNDAQWHFIVGVVDRDVGAKIYIDGNLDSLQNKDTSSYDLSNNRNPKIGFNDVGNFFEPFDGNIDDLRIYNRALSESEIHELYIPSPNLNDKFAPLGPGDVSTAFSRTPCGGAAAGTFTVTATFTNISSDTLTNLLISVNTLTGGNVLCNADGGPGGAGAILTVPPEGDLADGQLSPGESFVVELPIGLQTFNPFTFIVDVLGEEVGACPCVGLRDGETVWNDSYATVSCTDAKSIDGGVFGFVTILNSSVAMVEELRVVSAFKNDNFIGGVCFVGQSRIRLSREEKSPCEQSLRQIATNDGVACVGP